jgi:hypothetical protein
MTPDLGKRVAMLRGIGLLGTAAGLTLVLVGAILPFRKAELSRELAREAASAPDVPALERDIDRLATFPSPVARRDTIAWMLGLLTDLADPTHGVPEAGVRALVAHVEPYALPDDVEHGLALASVHTALAASFSRRADYDEAIDRLVAVKRAAPAFRPALYALFGLYTMGGNAAGMRDVGAEILARWPNDASTRQALEKLDSGRP